MIQFLLSCLYFVAFLTRSSDASSHIIAEAQRPLSSDPLSHQTPLLHLHRKLVEIESITGNEAEVGEYLVSYLKKLNLTVVKQPVRPFSSSSSHKPSRFNVLAYPGSKSKTRALFTSHIDTVPPFLPYELRNSGTEIWGRGSVDAKACVAAQTRAFAELYTSKVVGEGDVGLLFVVGEERGGDGMATANDLDLEWETVIFGEPTEGKLASGHKGFQELKIKVHGAAAHSGYPWLGQSANEIMIAALAALEDLAARDGTENGGLPSSEKYGSTTLNVGVMTGGLAPNVVAEYAEAIVALRLAAGTPKESFDICLETINKATAKFFSDKNGKHGNLTVEPVNNGYSPIDIDADIEGFEVITVNYGTDVPNLKGKHKRYLYGPGSILVAHSDHEHLKVSELEQAVEDYKKIVTTVLDR